MVAILTVFANHLWDWPRGGFVGVDVFFVISGFLITGNLLRTAETKGNVSFREFYWNRIRRIVPAATVVLAVTYLAASLLFLPFRAQRVGIDALFAAVFMANWHFVFQETNYFTASTETVSPIQHYWSLSIEEQFYFLWPALIFVIGVFVIHRSWSHGRRMLIVGGVMSAIVAGSLGWAFRETVASPAFAYFDTLARVWELGVGAALATATAVLAGIPRAARPVMSWAGLILIAMSMFLISNDSLGFPAPWALAPVTGAALVIAAGVGNEPEYQAFLRNPISTYIGDISYSLYLVHWPVIVLLGSIMGTSGHFAAAVVAISFGLAIASYHCVENPLRRADSSTFRKALHDVRRRRLGAERRTQYAVVAALALLVVGSFAYVTRPDALVQADPPTLAALAPAGSNPSGAKPNFGPLATELQGEIVESLKATNWPLLNPSMESVISGPQMAPDVEICRAKATPDPQRCTWGSAAAPTKVILVGDSIALNYAGPLRQIAMNSGGQIQVRTLAMVACAFTNELIERASLRPECTDTKKLAVDVINSTKPDIVVISNSYLPSQVVGSRQQMTPDEWSKSMMAIVDKFRGSTEKLVFLSPPPADTDINDCYSKRSSTPANCISRVTVQWNTMAAAEAKVAELQGGVWLDSRPWFCSSGQLCPSFAKETPTKHDVSHMAPPYGDKIYPVIAESLRMAGILP